MPRDTRLIKEIQEALLQEFNEVVLPMEKLILTYHPMMLLMDYYFAQQERQSMPRPPNANYGSIPR